MMPRIAMAALTALTYAAAIAFAIPANAATPSQPVAPANKPYAAVVQNDVTEAYQFRTRILVSPPSCQDFAKQADSVFISSALDDKTKTEELKKISAAAAAAGCLAP
jgi:hypothetical protein